MLAVVSLTGLLERVAKELLVHPAHRVLLHGNCRSQIILRSLDVVFADFATLVLHHDLLQFLVGIEDV